MAVSRKLRRKIVRLDRVFYWYVAPDYDDAGVHKLHILSEDKKFIVAYELDQADKPNWRPMLVVMGKEFEGLSGDYTGYRRVLTPIWQDKLITPKRVGEIIDWCYSKEKELILVNWMGEIFT